MNPQETVESVLAAAATEATVVAVSEAAVLNYRWAVSTPTTNGDTRSQTVTITAIARTRGDLGWATGTRSGRVADWPELLAAAEHDAATGEASSEGEPLPAAVLREDFAAAPQAPGQATLPTGLAEAFGRDAVEFFGYAEQSVDTTYVGTSTGSRWRTVEREGRLEVSGKSHGRARSAWHGASGDDLASLDVGVGVDDIHRGLRWQGSECEVPAEPMTVILSPSAVADLMIVLWWAAVARDAAEGHSPFSGDGPAGTALGRQLTDRDVTLRSDPHAAGIESPDLLWTPWSSAAATVFDTGSALEPVDWISAGRLSALSATRAAAQEFGLPFLASPGNLTLHDAAGQGSLAEVVARTERALLITSLWYIRDVDPQRMLVTGLTRDGSYLVVDGEVVGGAGNFRFNDSPLRLLSGIVDAGDPVRCLPREWGDYFTRTVMPPLVVEQFGLSTPSTAV
jgi:predicted Zn-dependent protease